LIPREELLRVRRIASRVNPRIKEWASLGDRRDRDRLGCTLAEGSRLVAEGLSGELSGEPGAAGGMRPLALLIADSGAEQPGAGAAFARAGALGIDRFSLADDCFAKVSGLKNADGIALVMSFTRERPALRELFSHPDAAWLVAAGVQDPGNAGALARTALAAGWSGCIYLEGADPVSPKFLRGGMGASFRLPCLSMTVDDFLAEWPDAAARLIIAVSGDDGDDFRRADYSPPVALLVGGERGLPEALSGLTAARAHIPLSGNVESLNLAVAAGILLFEAARPLHRQSPCNSQKPVEK
jgi:TrmH family RNA methyltransferase